MKKIIISLTIALLFFSCKSNNKIISTQENHQKLEHATLFSIKQLDSCKQIIVTNPWDSTLTLAKYVLVHRDSILPRSLPEGKLVRIPVQKIAAYSAIDVGVLDMLGAIENVKAVCEPHFIRLESISEGVKSNKIIDIGMSMKPNVEKILMADCDIIFTTPFKNTNYGPVEDTGIALAECASYMENEPLGRSEWIKFYAAFLDLSPKADSIFTEIKNRYNNIKKVSSTVKNRKTLITGKRYGQTWWVPGGDSYAAKTYKDASARYIWEEDASAGSLALSFEEVYLKAASADVWLIRYMKDGGELTLEELKKEYESYALFDAFKNKRVYGCNTSTTSYFVYASTQPDIELKDIATILYPELFDNKETTYYKLLK